MYSKHLYLHLKSDCIKSLNSKKRNKRVFVFYFYAHRMIIISGSDYYSGKKKTTVEKK